MNEASAGRRFDAVRAQCRRAEQHDAERRERLARDVLADHPRAVVIQFGINDAAVDVWKRPPATTPRVPLAEYEQNLRWIITRLAGGRRRPC